MHYQPSLPRLPIPKLEDTCRRYLNAQKPLLSKDEFEKTTTYVNEFLSKDGTSLQDELIKTDAKNCNTSYISGPWSDMYLRDRKPLPINYNPFIVLEPASDPKYNEQLVKSTNIIVSSLRFMKSLKENVLLPEIFYLNTETANNNLYHAVTRALPPKFSWYGAYLFKVRHQVLAQISDSYLRDKQKHRSLMFPHLVGDNILTFQTRNYYFRPFHWICRNITICLIQQDYRSQRKMKFMKTHLGGISLS